MGSAIGSVVGAVGGSFFGQPALGASLGGALGGAIGGNGSQGTPATTNNSINLPSWLSSPYQSQVSQAQTLGQTPYNSAMNQQVAGFNPQQTQAFGLTNQLVGQYQQPFGQALQQTGQLGQQATGGLSNPQFQSYMNPYINQVNQASNAQSFQNLGIAQNQLREQAAGSGAFGNDRLGLAQGQLSSNALMNMNAQNASNLAGGFNTALSGYQTGINQGLGASNQLGSLATGQQAAGLQGINALYGAGASQQQLQQSQYNAGQYNALQQAQYPWQQLANQQSIMGTPAQIYGHQQTTTQALQQPSGVSGGLMTAAALNGSGLSGAIGGLMNSGSAGLGSYGGGIINGSNYQTANLAGNGNAAYDALSASDNGGFMNSIGNFFSGLHDGGLVGYAKGGGVSANEAVGAPGYFHMMNRYTPHFEHGHAGYARGGMAGFKKGGLVDPSTLTQGMRSGGLLHKAPKGKASLTHPKSPKMPERGLAALQAAFGGQQMGQGTSQVGAQPNPNMPSMSALGAQQPQMGLMTGGMVPDSINGYAKGGMVWKKEAGINGCYADGGVVDPLTQAFTNPGSNYTLGDQIAFQKANNYVAQMLGQGQGGLPEGYRAGGIVGYDDGGSTDWFNSPIANYIDQLGTAFKNTGLAQAVTQPAYDNPNSYVGQHPYAATIAGATLPIAAAGDALGAGLGWAGRGAVGAAGAYPAVARGLIGAGALAAPSIEARMNQPQPQPAAPKAQPQAPTSDGGITQADIDYIDQLHNTANTSSQPQAPMGPYGQPLNMQSLAMAAGMSAGYAGHGNTAADIAQGAGGVEQQAMQQRQNDALMAYRGSIMGLNNAKAQTDIGNLQLKKTDAPWKIALQQAQANSANAAPQARAQQAIANLMKNYMTDPKYMMDAQSAYAKALQDYQQNPQGVGQMFGQQAMPPLPQGFVPRTQ